MVAAYLVFLLVLALERVVELLISRRNAAWSFDQGGVEYGARHLPYMKALHTGFFIACALEVVLLDRPFFPRLAVPMLGLVVLAELLRYWVVFTLGKRWNVRVIVVPGTAAVRSGPFRFLRHPNYLAVVVEGFAVPLVHSAWWTAIGVQPAQCLDALGAHPLRGERARCALPIAMERGQVLEDVRRVLEEHLLISDVREETDLFRDLELDSVQQLTFIVDLENNFEICFDEGDEASIRTIGDVVDIVSRRLSAL